MNDFARIDLGNGSYATVDSRDYPFLSCWTWRVSDKGYAITGINYGGCYKTNVSMHRLIMACVAREVQVDHINRNKLDNRRANLRYANATQNAANRFALFEKFGNVEYKGVYQNRHAITCSARIRVGKKTIYLASFTDRREAAKLYDAAARIAFGEFALVNFPDEPCDQSVTSRAEAILTRHGIVPISAETSEG